MSVYEKLFSEWLMVFTVIGVIVGAIIPWIVGCIYIGRYLMRTL